MPQDLPSADAPAPDKSGDDTPLLRIASVTKRFGGVVAVEKLSLDIRAGEFFALLGPSGCGKSTLLNLIGALDLPDSGTITVGGTDLRKLPDAAGYRASTVGFVFQFHHLIPTLHARENVQVPMIGRGLPRRERVAKADELLKACAIGHRAGASPSTLSGGERQRVAIARALANDPKLLLADEPTGALDSTTGAQIVELLLRLRAERGMTIVLVTNDDAVAGAADRTLRIRDGRVEGATPAATPLSA
jgi:ABC-type lipoprotein export system ATPase subunit